MDTRPTYNPATYKTSFKIHDNFIGFNEDKGIRIYNTNNSFLTTNSICNNTGTVNVAPGVIWASCLSVGGWESNSQPGTPATTSVATPSSYIYPNPASNAVHVWLNDKMNGRIFLNIYDEQERLVQSKPINKNASTLLETLNVSALSPGFYFLQIISESGKSILKFIKQ